MERVLSRGRGFFFTLRLRLNVKRALKYMEYNACVASVWNHTHRWVKGKRQYIIVFSQCILQLQTGWARMMLLKYYYFPTWFPVIKTHKKKPTIMISFLHIFYYDNIIILVRLAEHKSLDQIALDRTPDDVVTFTAVPGVFLDHWCVHIIGRYIAQGVFWPPVIFWNILNKSWLFLSGY